MPSRSALHMIAKKTPTNGAAMRMVTIRTLTISEAGDISFSWVSGIGHIHSIHSASRYAGGKVSSVTKITRSEGGAGKGAETPEVSGTSVAGDKTLGGRLVAAVFAESVSVRVHTRLLG